MQNLNQEAAAPSLDRVAGLARARGMTLTRGGEVVIAGHTYRDLDLECRDNLEAIAYLNELAADDAAHGAKVRALARDLWRWAEDATAAALLAGAEVPATYARKAHQIVRDRIAYVDDPDQVFRSSDVTLRLAVGNCVNTARLLCALMLARGVEARCVPVTVHKGDDEPTHTCAQIRLGGAWVWAEATIAAHFGEEPLTAARRLGVLRSDLA